MSMVLRGPLIQALVDDDYGHWKLTWDATFAVVRRSPPGRHEYSDRWILTVEAGQRAIDLSLLLTLIIAASIAIIGDGRIIDDVELVGGGQFSGGELLARAAGGGQERSAQEVLTAMGSPG